MGCDIHAYIEFKRKGRDHWRSFGGRINPGRNYFLFGRLADGVRGDGPALVPTRGMPSDVGSYARDDGFLFITEDGQGNDCCTLENARRWEPSKEWKLHDFVPHPDWHSHSWATAKEWEDAIKPCMEGQHQEPQYVAILAAMQSLEKSGSEVRIVYWFDN